MRIAVLERDRCQPKKCNHECITYCPKVRAGVPETIYAVDNGQPVISEVLCIGCGICVNKCPFDAIHIINLPDEMGKDTVHQYGENMFRLYRLPTPKMGQVVGLLGPNGIGKTTVLKFLAGEAVPNLGDWKTPTSWDKVLDHFSGTELHEYLRHVVAGDFKAAIKPQYVDKLPQTVKGNVRRLLKKVDERGRLDELVDQLEIRHTLDQDLDRLSGGELQRVAIAATALKDATVYLFDEPSSYLDVRQRVTAARVIRRLAEDGRAVVVVEHDLAILDWLADLVHVMYGTEAAYGVIALPRRARVAMNAYLQGFLPEENIRIHDERIQFHVHPPREKAARTDLVTFGALSKKYGEGFEFATTGGTIAAGEVVGVLGPNGTGKTTLVKMLAGVEKPTTGRIDVNVRVSYKPQYVKADIEGTVQDLFFTALGRGVEEPFFQHEVARPLGLDRLSTKEVTSLSGGELQRVAVALCLAREADLYLLDEPSAYLDAPQRMKVAKALRRVMEKRGTSALVVDHDVYFIDLVSDALMVFGGEAGVRGTCDGPLDLRAGMNRFLKDVDVTFRRDPDTLRPRVNKPGSGKDREQKAAGEYYYEALVGGDDAD